jgi:diguanylate cyclase (GGDEF)-like protein/PAS domain S-box-containing protein
MATFCRCSIAAGQRKSLDPITSARAMTDMKSKKISELRPVHAKNADTSVQLSLDVNLLAEQFLRKPHDQPGQKSPNLGGVDLYRANGNGAGGRQKVSPDLGILHRSDYLFPVPACGAMQGKGLPVGVRVADPWLKAAPGSARPPAEEEARYRAMVEAFNGFIYITSEDYDLEFLNRRFVEHLGADAVGQKCFRALHSLDRACPWCARDRVFQGERVDLEILSPRDNCWYACSSTPIHFAGKVSKMTIVQDITERKLAEELTRRLAYHDPLTGLPNRSLFNDRLALALAMARRHRQKLAVMMLDLDRFKDINDNLGHQVGDALLIGVAERLTGLLRKSDTVARLGGDEFILIFPEVSRAKDVVEIARKVMGTFSWPFVCQGLKAQVTASVGIALFPDHGEDPEALVQRADLAMYRAKKEGCRGFRIFSPSQEGKEALFTVPQSIQAPGLWRREEASQAVEQLP